MENEEVNMELFEEEIKWSNLDSGNFDENEDFEEDELWEKGNLFRA